MPKKIRFVKKVIVDSGEIVVLLKKPEQNEVHVPVNKGLYKITLTLNKSWHTGKVYNFDFLEVKEDSFLCISDGFIRGTDKKGRETFFKANNLHKKGCSISSGGDGIFSVIIDLVKINKIPQNPYQKKLKNAKIFFKENKFNEKNVKVFVNKFLKTQYIEEISNILVKERLKESKKMLAEIKSILKKIETKGHK